MMTLRIIVILTVAVLATLFAAYSLGTVGQWVGMALSLLVAGWGLVKFARYRADPRRAAEVLEWLTIVQVIFGFWAVTTEDLRQCEREGVCEQEEEETE